MNNYLVIPDLHGQHTVLLEALSYVKKTITESPDSYTVIFLGDYCDRGEPGMIGEVFYDDAGSVLVVEELLSFKAWCDSQGCSCIFILGNHDEMFEDYFRHEDISIMGYDFFESTAEVFEGTNSVYKMLELIDMGQLYHYDKAQQLFFVHAGIDPEIEDPEQNEPHTYQWIRHRFIDSPKRFPFKVIFGHTPFNTPHMKPDRIGLDGGACYQTPDRSYLNVLKIEQGQFEIKRFKNNF